MHGREGLGKLAAFGTARYLECVTKRDGEAVIAFRMYYDGIRQKPPDEPYPVTRIDRPDALVAPDGSAQTHGTRMRLSGLRQKRRLGQNQFFLSMSRRFAVDENQMAVWINGKRLGRFNYPVQFRFPRDGAPDGVTVDADGWAGRPSGVPCHHGPARELVHPGVQRGLAARRDCRRRRRVASR